MLVICSAVQDVLPWFAQRSFCLPNFSGIVGRMEPQWERLGQYVQARRKTKGWSQDQVTANGGPSDSLQTEIESLRWKPTRSVRGTLLKIDAGMEWSPGSSSRILEGGEPGELHDVAAVPRIEHPDLHLMTLLWRETSGIVRLMAEVKAPVELLTQSRYMLAVTVDVISEVLLNSPDAAAAKDFLQRMYQDFFELQTVIETREGEQHGVADETQPNAPTQGRQAEEVLDGSKPFGGARWYPAGQSPAEGAAEQSD